MKRFVPLLLPLASALALAACSPSSPSDDNPAATASAPAAAVSSSATAMAGTTAKTTPRHAASVPALGKYHWQLTSATASDGSRIDALFANPDKPLQLDFRHGQLDISNTCNGMHGAYEVANGKLKVVGPMAQTMKACANDKLMAMDKAVGQILQGTMTMTLKTSGDQPRLMLIDAKGDKLVFAGEPTASTRYGSKGKTVFLEVAAQTVECEHPPGTADQCLKVRERHFNDKGLTVGKPGQWHPLTHSIDGYTHTDGVRNVLRIKQYKVKNAPAGAASTAYVLDMVVESEVSTH
ncbi:MAG TPA: META and DUF4377 domain-containing protein [Oleiagrimonas sp.]|nr:META and DUF4377 domain-containing protein [Oleiagrimonas sp.]